ncbi:trypsin-like serine protease [Corynebacterium renale]|uniref:trypsin-like serine protease n=1 Tax=Corynebacterium renale TaxID=1724 RepID=UPI000653A190|nr:trypsin-like serine protease [Corynebacterium renale]
MSFLWQKNIECTIGYVDGSRKVAYTARHCAQEGDPTDTNYIGVEIRTSDGRRIGETVHPQKYQGRTPYLSYTAKESDLVAIALDDDVIAGANVYSGDSIVDYSYLSPGTRVCTYGRVAKATRCGTISHLHDDAFVRTVRTTESGGRWSVTGDSGGPVWLENGGGFVGIHNGSYLVDGVYKGTFFTGF